MRRKLISVSLENWETLRKMGNVGDTFDDVVTKVLNKGKIGCDAMKDFSYTVGNLYAVLSITKNKAQKHGIDDANRVSIEERPDGILIKKIEA